MKRFLSAVLTLCLVLTVCSVSLSYPASAAVEQQKITFDFSNENVPSYSYTQNAERTQKTYNGKTYYPINAYNNSSGDGSAITVGYEKLTFDGENYDTMKICTGGVGNHYSNIVLLDKNGNPYELKENTSYSVSYTIFGQTVISGATRPVYLSVGGLDHELSAYSEAQGAWKFTDTKQNEQNLIYPYSARIFQDNKATEITKYSATVELFVGAETVSANNGGDPKSFNLNNFLQISARNGNNVWISELTVTEILPPKESMYVNDGLVALYSAQNNTGEGFNKNATTWADLRGENDFTVKLDSNNYFTKGGYHLYNQRTELPAAITNLVNSGEFTIELHLGKVTPTDTAESYNNLLSDYDDKFSLFRRTSSDKLEFKMQGLASGNRPQINNALENMNNSVVTVVYKADTIGAIYINGVLMSSKVPTSATFSVRGMTIGFAENERECEVTYRTMRFYNRALNETEIAKNAQIDLSNDENVDYNFGGTSVLTDIAAETAGGQTIRVYYSYSLNENGKINVGANEYTLKERGLLISQITTLNKNITLDNVGNDIIRMGITENFDSCWAFDSNTNTVTYSNYVKNFKFDDLRRLKFRGYLVLDDGTSEGKVVYTDAVSTSVVQTSGKDIVDDVAYNENYEFSYGWQDSLPRLKALNYNFAFGIQTDTHFALGDTGGSYPYVGYSISALSRAEGVNLDYIVNLGDILKGYEDPVLDNKFNMLQSAKALTKRFTTGTACPVLYAVGNHDNNIMWAQAQDDENEIITKKELYDIFGKSVQNTAPTAVFDGESMYYYLDFPEKGIRAIMLDTNDFADSFEGASGSSAISDKQLAWFRDTALNTDYSVIVMSHVPFIVEEGFNQYYVTNSDGVLAATDAFKENGGEIIGFFYGHLHEQAATTRNGDNHIIFKNSGRYAEVITLDTATKTINTVAFGYGTNDRTFSYGTQN